MAEKLQSVGNSSSLLGSSAGIYTPIGLLGVLIIIIGLIGMYSIRNHQYYVESVGLELMPLLALATASESAMHLAFNAERNLSVAVPGSTRHQRGLRDHAGLLSKAVKQLTVLMTHFEKHHATQDRLMEIQLVAWVDASEHVAKLATNPRPEENALEAAMADSMIAFTALKTHLKDMEQSAINSFDSETKSGLTLVKLSRFSLLTTVGFGLVMCMLGQWYLRRKHDQLMDRLGQHVSRQDFNHQIGEALEMEDSPEGLNKVATRVLSSLCADNPAELLMNNSDEKLKTVAENANAGAAHCQVGNTLSCVALRRGQLTLFPDSHAINACPHLVDRGDKSVAAICAPVTFMGAGLGVLHIVYPQAQLPREERVEQIRVFSTQFAARSGTVRAFGRTERLALTDPGTGLLNRRGLEQHVSDLNLDKKPYALAMADLDYFKRLNDSYSHETGDLALKAFAEVLLTSLPPESLICRWGGEEFTIVWPDLTAEDAYGLAENVRSRLAERLKFGDLPNFTVSVGLADSSMGGTFRDLSLVADLALYQAKSDGRDRVVVGSTAQPDAVGEQLGTA